MWRAFLCQKRVRTHENIVTVQLISEIIKFIIQICLKINTFKQLCIKLFRISVQKCDWGIEK